MERVILHCDMNSFYASVECLYHPEARDKPVAVGGDVDARHGIILAKNQLAKKYHVTTGEAIWQAKKKCPDLIIYPPNYPRYLLYSQRVRAMFNEYTDLVDPFGLDECWLDVTGSKMFGSGGQIADKLRERIKFELGITASVGVSFNKIFAKLGSDLRKPDYTTVISKDNYKELVWPLNVEELLYVGASSKRTLNSLGIYTIGQLANSDTVLLQKCLGKWGVMLKDFANGNEFSPVAKFNKEEIIKSIGNSITTYRDLTSNQDVEVVMSVLADSVASRLKDHHLIGKVVAIGVRDNELKSFTRQLTLDNPTNISYEIYEAAVKLFKENYFWQKPLRSVGVRVAKLSADNGYQQLSLFSGAEKRSNELKTDEVIDEVRKRFGYKSICKTNTLLDKTLADFNPKDDHIIFPESYF